jgi:hypothetical protein
MKSPLSTEREKMTIAALLAHRIEKTLRENWELTMPIGYWLSEIRELHLEELFDSCPAPVEKQPQHKTPSS